MYYLCDAFSWACFSLILVMSLSAFFFALTALSESDIWTGVSFALLGFSAGGGPGMDVNGVGTSTSSTIGAQSQQDTHTVMTVAYGLVGR